jgi:hypothetical protein
MKRFVTNLFCFAFVAFLIPAVLAFVLPSNPDGFYKVYLKKVKRAETLKKPRILIFGGSDVLHAIDSKLIQDSTHRGVANMGLTAALGYDIIVNDALKYSKEGDVVLLSLGAFARCPAWGGADEVSMLVNYSPQKLFDLSWNNIKVLGRGIYCLLKMKLKYLLHSLSSDDIQTYGASTFNEYGDSPKTFETNFVRTPVNADTIFSTEQVSFMKSVCRRIRQIRDKGCVVFIIPETIEKKTFLAMKDRICAVQHFYKQEGVDYLFSPELSAVPDTMIYNMQYHVNYHGALYYSNLIARRLKTIMNSSR